MTVLLIWFSRLPMSALYGFGYLVYVVVYRILGVRKSVVLSNLHHSFPEKSAKEIDKLARRFYRNYCDVLMEMIKSISMPKEEFVERVQFENLELLEQELSRGQPVLLTLAHHGNIEWLLLSMSCQLSYPSEAIYRPLANKKIEQLTTRVYTRFGGTLIDDRSVVKEIMSRKQIPRVVAIVSDQSPNIDDHCVWVEFLNQETAFYLAPDTIARFVNYPVFFVSMQRISRGRYSARLKSIAQPPYTGRENKVVSAYIENVEAQIRQCPEDWLWIHKRWKRKKSVYS